MNTQKFSLQKDEALEYASVIWPDANRMTVIAIRLVS